MALVRVYCGLASAQQSEAPASAAALLTAAVVDDAGRLLDVCEITDDPSGYARLSVLLVERSNGSTGVAIASDDDAHLVTSLFNAAGRPLAFADEEAVDDYAERFADDESPEEIESPPAERRAVGLARALQAGALSAVVLTTPRDLAGYKPVLAAHAALINGRQAAAVALREVLRELYPAALRAYPDPAEPVSLAVLDALPEPSMLNGHSSGRLRDATATEVVAARLADEGIADGATVTEAITALRVAVAETARRNGTSKALTAAVAETVRQAVAAVRACDAACDTLVGTLTGRVGTPSSVPGRRSARRTNRSEAPAVAVPLPRQSREPVMEPAATRVPAPSPRRGRQQPVPGAPMAPQPMAPPPVAPPPITPRPAAPAAANGGLPAAPRSAPPGGVRVPTPPPLRRQSAGSPRVSPVSAPPPVSPGSAPPAPAARYTDGLLEPSRQRSGGYDDQLPGRPVSAPPPPPPGITPIAPSQRAAVPPADNGEPFRPTLTAAAINSARAERQQRLASAVDGRRQAEAAGVDRPPSPGINASDVSIPVPAPRPSAPESAPPGSRANWPLLNSSDDRAAAAPGRGYPYGESPNGADADRRVTPSTDNGRVKPPWQSDDLPPEPPTLRLVEPPMAERPARPDLGLERPGLERPGLERPGGDPLGNGAMDRGESRLEPPPLRLVESNGSSRRALTDDIPPAPVSEEGDGDLLIFAAARSAWFVGHDEQESDMDWSSQADDGWRAAQQAAEPSVGAETRAGLPKRVPQANLVPGSPLREERPLRIVRDPASIAAHTTGYFRGWRRGQEIGGYAVGGRPGREAAGGWDFARDGNEDESREYEYRSAGYRS